MRHLLICILAEFYRIRDAALDRCSKLKWERNDREIMEGIHQEKESSLSK